MAKAILPAHKPGHQSRTPRTPQIKTAIELAQIRLRRAQDVLSVLAFCADKEAELSLGPVAVAAREQIDRVLDGLAEAIKGSKDGQP